MKSFSPQCHWEYKCSHKLREHSRHFWEITNWFRSTHWTPLFQFNAHFGALGDKTRQKSTCWHAGHSRLRHLRPLNCRDQTHPNAKTDFLMNWLGKWSSTKPYSNFVLYPYTAERRDVFWNTFNLKGWGLYFQLAGKYFFCFFWLP